MWASIALALTALTAGCGRPQPASPTPTAVPTAVVALASPTPPAPRMALIAPAESAHRDIAAQAEAALQSMASAAAMEFVRLDALPSDAAGIELLVVLPPDPGLQAWASAHPDVHAVSLGIPGATAGPNLSVLAPDGFRYDQLGFALGFLAAMVTPEYRLGALALDSSPDTLALTRGFIAGGTYYCGLCRPIHPPYLEYPAQLGTTADLAAGDVTAVLVAPQPDSVAALGLPANPALMFVGVGEPPGELAASWIASAGFDLAGALETTWAQIQTAQPATSAELPLRFYSVNAGVSEGRLALAEALLADLAAGAIDTGVDPLTGELR